MDSLNLLDLALLVSGIASFTILIRAVLRLWRRPPSRQRGV